MTVWARRAMVIEKALSHLFARELPGQNHFHRDEAVEAGLTR